jgi:hypothetical protein
LSLRAASSQSGLSGWKYWEDSLWMKMASGRASRMACMARRFARQRCFKAVTKARSLFNRSFHQPKLAEKEAVMKISLTGV